MPPYSFLTFSSLLLRVRGPPSLPFPSLPVGFHAHFTHGSRTLSVRYHARNEGFHELALYNILMLISNLPHTHLFHALPLPCSQVLLIPMYIDVVASNMVLIGNGIKTVITGLNKAKVGVHDTCGGPVNKRSYCHLTESLTKR